MLRRLSLAIAVASAVAGTAWAEDAPLSAKTDLVTVYKDAVDNNADLVRYAVRHRLIDDPNRS